VRAAKEPKRNVDEAPPATASVAELLPCSSGRSFENQIDVEGGRSWDLPAPCVRPPDRDTRTKCSLCRNAGAWAARG